METEQVPWSCDDEWISVYGLLRSNRYTALNHLKCWNSRMRNILPVGISATIAVLTALDQIDRDRNSLVTLFCASGTIVQSIGLLLERFRDTNSPMHKLGAELGIPHWVMEIRHQVAHQVAVQLNIDAFQSALEAIYDSLINHPKSYWKEQSETYKRRRALRDTPISQSEVKALEKLVQNIMDNIDEGVDLKDIRDICREKKYRKRIASIITSRFDSFADKDAGQLARIFKQLYIEYDVLLNFALLRRVMDESNLGLEKQMDQWIITLLGHVEPDTYHAFEYHCAFIKEIGDVPRSSSKTILRNFNTVVKSSRLLDGEQRLLSKKIIDVLRILDWFTGYKGSPDDLGFNTQRKRSDEKHAVWNTSESNWSNVPAGLRHGYDVDALYSDILSTSK